MTALLALLVVVASVASLTSALLVVFAVRDARLLLADLRAQHPPPVPPRTRTTTRSAPREPLAYGAQHPTPDPSRPHASPFHAPTMPHGTPHT